MHQSLTPNYLQFIYRINTNEDRDIVIILLDLVIYFFLIISSVII